MFASRFVWSVAALWLAVAPRVQSQPSVCRVEGQLQRLQTVGEASGIAASRRTPGVLWSHNDSGEPVLVALSANGAVIGRVRVTGARVVDWEDVAVAACPQGTCIYIADIGDNNGARGSVTIYRVPEPEPKAAATATAETLSATYPDGPRDAEALLVLPDGSLFIVTKEERGPATVYRAPSFRPGESVKLQRVASLDAGVSKEKGGSRSGRVTGGAVSADGQWIALRTNTELMFYAARDFSAGKTRELFRYNLAPLHEPQGEGVAFGAGTDVWLSGEGGGRSGTLARLTCALRNH